MSATAGRTRAVDEPARTSAVAAGPRSARDTWAGTLASPTVTGLVSARPLLILPDAADNTQGLLS